MVFLYFREHYQEQAESQERARASRAPAPDIDVLMNRNPAFSPVSVYLFILITMSRLTLLFCASVRDPNYLM